jgi:hypothetical protein
VRHEACCRRYSRDGDRCSTSSTPIPGGPVIGGKVIGWYRITAEVLKEAGVEYEMYSASDPHAIVVFLQ